MSGIDGFDGTIAPPYLFIMHVVSVVFPDEAVMRTHDAHLTLFWQFGDLKPTIIPLETGRVVHFDFSTQHELQMNKSVTDYMKKEELQIMITETENVKNVFASCALPLRQMLLNVNRKVDMSLPLKAGPYLNEKVPVTMHTCDVVGVLDLWCMLLCEQIKPSQTVAQCTANPKTPYNNEQPKEKHRDNTLEIEMAQQPEAVRQWSFQRDRFSVPSATVNPNPTTSLEERQVGFQVPRNENDKNMSFVPDYKKETNGKKYNGVYNPQRMSASRTSRFSKVPDDQVIEITILWLTLNENCEPMLAKNRKLYVAYTFLGRDGAELETPVSLPVPKNYSDKCIFNFSKTFNLTEMDMRILEHMVTCRSQNRNGHNSNDCIVFTVVSEPPEDPLGLENCEDIGWTACERLQRASFLIESLQHQAFRNPSPNAFAFYRSQNQLILLAGIKEGVLILGRVASSYAFLYLGDMLAYCSGNSFTEALPVRGARAPARACGVLAVRVDGLDVLRPCRDRTT